MGGHSTSAIGDVEFPFPLTVGILSEEPRRRGPGVVDNQFLCANSRMWMDEAVQYLGEQRSHHAVMHPQGGLSELGPLIQAGSFMDCTHGPGSGLQLRSGASSWRVI